MHELSTPHTMYGDPLIRATFQDRPVIKDDFGTRLPKIMQSTADPELIVRHDAGLYIAEGEASATTEEHRQELTERFINHSQAVRLLHNEFGLHSPGYIVSYESTDGRVRGLDAQLGVYVATNRVHGRYFAIEHLEGASRPDYKFEDMPEEITVQAMSSLLSYYEAVLEDRVMQYQADLRLANLIYGRQEGDYEDHIYFFDIEDYYFADTSENGYLGASNTVGEYYTDFMAMQEAYGHDFPELEERYNRLWKALRQKHDDTSAERSDRVRARFDIKSS